MIFKLKQEGLNGMELNLYDWTDEPSIKLSELLRSEIEYTYKWNGRYIFSVPHDEIVYIIDPKTKRLDCIPTVEGGGFIQNEPDAIKITPEEVRRALS